MIIVARAFDLLQFHATAHNAEMPISFVYFLPNYHHLHKWHAQIFFWIFFTNANVVGGINFEKTYPHE